MKSNIIKFIGLFLFCSFYLHSQEEQVTLKVNGGEIEGTLLLPEVMLNVPVVLIIAGSGPTDRNGNNSQMENNSLKMMAEELQSHGIASLRYDKRGVGQSTEVEKDELTLRLETFSDDAKAWIDLLHADQRFSRVIVAGHSEGALLGLLASARNKKVSAYISIAGPGRPLDQILKEQLANLPPDIEKTMFGMIDKLKKGDTLGDVPPIFYALFRPSIQPFMISFLKYDPQKEIKKLKVPILILQGTTDIQVKEKDALALQKAQPNAKIRLIKNMNHVLKDCEDTDKKVQLKTYEDPLLPLNKEFAEALTGFILGLNALLQVEKKK